MKTKLFFILFALLSNINVCLADDGNGLPNNICTNSPCSNDNGCHDKQCVNGWPIFENCG
jgi:hypothetical protein